MENNETDTEKTPRSWFEAMLLDEIEWKRFVYRRLAELQPKIEELVEELGKQKDGES